MAPQPEGEEGDSAEVGFMLERLYADDRRVKGETKNRERFVTREALGFGPGLAALYAQLIPRVRRTRGWLCRA
jgi:hypothetical protein